MLQEVLLVGNNGIKDTTVIFTPNNSGRFYVSWTPNKNLQNNYYFKNGIKYPGNDHMGAFGCDSYDISGTVGGGGSNGALHGMTKFHMDEGPTNHFFFRIYSKTSNSRDIF